MNKIVSSFEEANSSLSKKLTDVMDELEQTRMKYENQNQSITKLTSELGSKNEVIDALTGKMDDLKAQNDSLKLEQTESRKELQTFKIRAEHLEEELAKSSKLQVASADQMVLSVEERLSVDRRNSEMKLEIERLTTKLTENNEKLMRCQSDLDSVTEEFMSHKRVTNSMRAELESQISQMTLNLSKAKSEIVEMETENGNMKHIFSLKESEVGRLQGELKVIETEHKKLVEEFRIKGSSLILENSKMKEELENLHKAFGEAQVSAERSNERFDELQKLYSALNEKMRLEETDVCKLTSQKVQLEELLRSKEDVLVRLCSNFNELLAIFRECQDLGLDHDSSATDIDDGFIRLKRRLLDLSQDYITLNNRNKVLEKEALALTSKLTDKEGEIAQVRKKCEKKCDSFLKTMEKIEAENRALIAQKIEQEDAMKKMREKFLDMELQFPKDCQDCGYLRTQLQQLKIDLVDKDSAISTLELHIQSCCEHNRKKALQYKHELHACKRQLDAHTSYAGDFGLSPKKSKGGLTLKVDVGTQAGESSLHHLTGGFVERFKIRELEEKVTKLEKERTVLKRLCKIRSDRIHELESSEGRSLSSNNSAK
ncbi:hypothetical protein GE061_018658 [Apolygus lucorum]|uniref:Uncharacterized protein n=1 Tax=Apolygus lucorum TaxID=248454 RepID=A0A8S9XH85_APOLU|nr:hypothetical protein GE061_018658 [Apolygus lucorum]